MVRTEEDNQVSGWAQKNQADEAVDMRLFDALFVAGERETDETLSGLMSFGKWRERFIEPRGLLINFVNMWTKYTSKTLANIGAVPWNYIEGYTDVTRRLMWEISTIEVVDYSENVQKAMYACISNEKLLSPMMHLILDRIKYIHCPQT